MNSKVVKYLTNALKVAILAVAIFFIHRSIEGNENFNDDFMKAVHNALQWKNAWWLVLLFLLIAVNWSFEALKWKYLVSKLETITFLGAFKGVLTGLTMSFVSTTNAGAYFGRVWQLKHERRYEVLGGIVINSFSQTAITYFFGGFGLNYYLMWNGTLPETWFWPYQVFYGLVVLICIVLVFRSGKSVRLLQRMTKVYRYLEIISKYTFRDNLIVLGLSSLRYITYFSQFYIVLQLFGIELPLGHLVSGISLVYLAKSIIPNFSFLTDLGIREFTAMQLMGENGYGVPDAMIISATLSLWLINVLFPVIVGSVFTWQMRILSNKTKFENLASQQHESSEKR